MQQCDYGNHAHSTGHQHVHLTQDRPAKHQLVHYFASCQEQAQSDPNLSAIILVFDMLTSYHSCCDTVDTFVMFHYDMVINIKPKHDSYN